MASDVRGAGDGRTFPLQLQIRDHSSVRGQSAEPTPLATPSNRWFSTVAAAGEGEAAAVKPWLSFRVKPVRAPVKKSSKVNSLFPRKFFIYSYL